MRSAGGVTLDGQGDETGDSRAQSLLHASEPRVAGSRRGRIHLDDEVASEGIVVGDQGARGVADDLRDEVEVLDPVEIVGDGAEPLVGGDLLEVRLGQEDLVLAITVIGTSEQLLSVLHDQLLIDDRAVPPLSLTLDGEPVPP